MEYREKLQKIKAFAFDVDGVYSSFMITLPGGEMLRTMDSKDGLITRLAINAGFKIAIITLGDSESVRARFNRLGIKDDYYDSTVITTTSKAEVLEMFAKKHGLQLDEIMYGGDDLPDIECLKKAGLGVCPADAVEEVRAVADYVSTRKGGKSFVREVVEMVLKSQNVKYF
ncbi:MAG: HAD hydrolase family protein [Bacteroidales bacterium]|nr:HAD hydrolase family protein [Bacteroidales bacterium]